MCLSHTEWLPSQLRVVTNRLASAGRGFVYDVLGDDDDYVVPYRWDCAVVDDDEVYSEDSCGKADYTACWEVGGGGGRGVSRIRGHRRSPSNTHRANRETKPSFQPYPHGRRSAPTRAALCAFAMMRCGVAPRRRRVRTNAPRGRRREGDVLRQRQRLLRLVRRRVRERLVEVGLSRVCTVSPRACLPAQWSDTVRTSVDSRRKTVYVAGGATASGTSSRTRPRRATAPTTRRRPRGASARRRARRARCTREFITLHYITLHYITQHRPVVRDALVSSVLGGGGSFGGV